MNQYFISNGKSFDEVDEHIYDNYQFVENVDGSVRYSATASRFCVRDGAYDLSNLKDVTASQMGMVCRILGITVPLQTFALNTPPDAFIRKGRSYYLYSHGRKWSPKESESKLAA